MNAYDLIFEELQSRVDSGELTLEQANEVNDLAYNKYVTEKLETNILDKVGRNKKYTLYHCSNKKFKTIKPNSLNIGTRLSKMRTSSFWSIDEEGAILFGLLHFIAADTPIPFKLNLHDKMMYVLDSEFVNKKTNKTYTSEEVLKLIYDSNNKNFPSEFTPLYIHKIKDVPVKDVGKGQYAINEYTLDKEIKVDDIKKLSYNDVKPYITFCKMEEYIKKKDDEVGRTRHSLAEWLIYKNPDKVIDKRRDEYKKAIDEKRYDRETRSIYLDK